MASDCTIVDSLSSLFSSCFEMSDEREAVRSSIGSVRSKNGNEILMVLTSFGFWKLDGVDSKIELQRLRRGTSAAMVRCKQARCEIN